jgi:hypothetical protein
MKAEEIKQRYEQLYHQMANSREVRQMKIFGDAEKWAFDKVLATDQKTAEAWVAKLEAIEWNNYLSDTEASHIATTLLNQDGSMGAVWDKATFLGVIEKGGGEAERMPYYNSNALWVVAAMIYSDHAKSIAEDMGYGSVAEVPVEKLAMSTYRKAVEKLTDKDRKFFIRPYFDEYLMG